MALIRFRFEAEGTGGVRVPGKVWFRFTPTARRVITGTPDTVVLTESFTRELVAGALDEVLAPNDPAVWVWEIEEHVGREPARTIYVTVPDVPELDYPDLVAVDPATLAPTAVPPAAWWAALDAAVSGEGVQGPAGPAGPAGPEGPVAGARVTVSATEPATPAEGDVWFDIS